MSDCHHDWSTAGGQLHVIVVADDWQGVTTGVTRCAACGAHGLLQLLAWQGKRLAERVYMLSPLAAAVAAVFLRNMNTNYCDLSRHGQEFEALIAAADPPAYWIATRLPHLNIAAVRPIPAGIRPRVVDWRQLPVGTPEANLRALFSAIPPEET